MKKILMTTALLSGLLAPCAMAQEAKAPAPPSNDGSYISISGGGVGESDYSFAGGAVRTQLDSGTAFGGAWGVSAGHWRFEMAGVYRDQDGASNLTNDASFSAFTLDLNGYYDFTISGPVRPYVGIGAGVAGISISDGAIDDTGDALNLQAMAGLSVPIGDRASLFAEARVQRIAFKVDVLGNEEDVDLSNSAFLAGVRFRI